MLQNVGKKQLRNAFSCTTRVNFDQQAQRNIMFKSAALLMTREGLNFVIRNSVTLST